MKYHLLIIAIIFAAIAFAADASAQTCNDGCFYSNTYQGTDALSNYFSGGNDTAFGSEALVSNTGVDNTALGTYAMLVNTTGTDNTAVGYSALYNNTDGFGNSAVGVNALLSNANGSYNTAIGDGALSGNTTGYYNTACGFGALFSNIGGVYNTASGFNALFSNTTGNNNTATGISALVSNTSGSDNTASGFFALGGNITGSNNTALGYKTLFALTTGGSNIAVGQLAGSALTTGSNNIDIGNNGVAGESKTIRIGKSGTQTTTIIAGITGTTVAGGVGVIIGSNGKLGTVVSSARFKEAIKPMDKASEAILALKPVTFRYRHELDPDGIPQFGLVAEQVEKVNPDLVARDEQGKPYTVRYEAVNAMLLNEFLKEHRKVEKLEATVAQRQEDSQVSTAQQEKEIRALTATVKEQAAQIRRVSERIEVSKAAPQLVARDR
jgi:hypothetical protein